jgi:hypothetical protein
VKITHTITLDERKAEMFRVAGIEVPRSDNRLVKAVTFQITEEDPRWEKVCRLVKQSGALDIRATTFSSAELKSAQYLAMLPAWHQGYPEPEDDFGYLHATYDLKEYCKTCGMGARQVAPFRMKKPPQWGRKSILQLNWVFDEYFAKADVWESVFRPLGIKCRSVVLHKTSAVIDSVVQLDVTDVNGLEMRDQPYVECVSCHRNKFDPRVVGFFPPLQQATDSNIFKSTQYFDSEANAYRQVLCSSALYKEINDARVAGVEFQACQKPSAA